jgi:hypothetical protein
MRIKGTEWIKISGPTRSPYGVGKVTTLKIIRPYKYHAGRLTVKSGYVCEEQTGQIIITNTVISRYKLLKHYRLFKRSSVLAI